MRVCSWLVCVCVCERERERENQPSQPSTLIFYSIEKEFYLKIIDRKRWEVTESTLVIVVIVVVVIVVVVVLSLKRNEMKSYTISIFALYFTVKKRLSQVRWILNKVVVAQFVLQSLQGPRITSHNRHWTKTWIENSIWGKGLGLRYSNKVQELYLSTWNTIWATVQIGA